jgi:hypothetical protein
MEGCEEYVQWLLDTMRDAGEAAGPDGIGDDLVRQFLEYDEALMAYGLVNMTEAARGVHIDFGADQTAKGDLFRIDFRLGRENIREDALPYFAHELVHYGVPPIWWTES